MERHGDKWSRAWRYARTFLGNYRDERTASLREDIAQEAVVHAWRWRRCPADGGRLREAMRTIARRHRLRSLATDQGPSGVTLVSFEADGVDEPEARAANAAEQQLRIAGRRVPIGWARVRLRGVMAGFSTLDRRLLLGFHEGFCCAELAQRFGRSPACVKSRLHRARRRLRNELEGLVRVATSFEVPETTEENE